MKHNAKEESTIGVGEWPCRDLPGHSTIVFLGNSLIVCNQKKQYVRLLEIFVEGWLYGDWLDPKSQIQWIIPGEILKWAYKPLSRLRPVVFALTLNLSSHFEEELWRSACPFFIYGQSWLGYVGLYSSQREDFMGLRENSRFQDGHGLVINFCSQAYGIETWAFVGAFVEDLPRH